MENNKITRLRSLLDGGYGHTGKPLSDKRKRAIIKTIKTLEQNDNTKKI